jgi:hypothetical protein
MVQESSLRQCSSLYFSFIALRSVSLPDQLASIHAVFRVSERPIKDLGSENSSYNGRTILKMKLLGNRRDICNPSIQDSLKKF